ncbi:MAG: response regulator [bacterium]|nr:response regulator [bacterium]
MALNILVVDDSAVMRAMIKKTLTLCGLPLGEISEASNGCGALEVLQNSWVDLALIDINMPEMNGIELIDEIRKRPDIADLLLIVISTESSQTRIDFLNDMGVGFVHKPFTPESVKAKIMEITGVQNVESDENLVAQDSSSDF